MDGIRSIITGKEGEDAENDPFSAIQAAPKEKAESKSESKGSKAEKKSSRGESKRSESMEAAEPKNFGEDSEAEVNANGQGEELIDMVMAIHESCNPLNATPKDYISFLHTWHALFTMKKKELLRDLGHLEAGLFKLDSASEIVNDLRTNAVQQEKDLRVAQAAADRAMEEISKAITSSTQRRNEVGGHCPARPCTRDAWPYRGAAVPRRKDRVHA